MYATIFIIVSSIALYYILKYFLVDNDDDSLFLGTIELSLSLTTVVILIYIAISIYSNYIEKVNNLEILTESAGLKVDMTVYYAEHGKWPTIIPMPTTTKNLINLQADGTIVVTRYDSGQKLGFRPYIPKTEGGVNTDTIVWLCGYAQYPTESTSSDTQLNYTTIPAKQLVSACAQ